MCMSDGGVNGSRISVSNSGACSRGDITNGKATKNEGEPCTNSSECKQICCSCSPRSTKSSSVLLCTDGKCATKEQACCDLLTSLSCAP